MGVGRQQLEVEELKGDYETPAHSSFSLCFLATALYHALLIVGATLWRVDYEKPMRTGHKQGEMQLNSFS
jgi:hypothetical protein